MYNHWLICLKKLKVFCSFVLFCSSLVFIQSCTPRPVRQQNLLSERDLVYQKGISLFKIQKYDEAAPFFIKVIHQDETTRDHIYDASLWCLSVIYDKQAQYDKALLTLIELEKRKPYEITLFKIQLGIAKNYFRLGNTAKAFEMLRIIEQDKPHHRLAMADLYYANLENSQFNFDSSFLDELKFFRESQKYFLFVMESNEPKLNAEASTMLVNMYKDFLKLLEKPNLEDSYKRRVAVQVLDNLRALDAYKLDEHSDKKPVKDFFTFSNQKQTEIIDWLHK